MEPVRIVTATDHHYFPHLVVMLRSLIDSNPGVPFDVLVLSDEEQTSDWPAIQSLMHDGLTLRWHHLDSAADLRVDSHIARATWLRLFMHRILADDIARVLYLDPDMLVVGNILPLWHLDLGGLVFAAVEQREYPGKTSLGLEIHEPYLNAGVLLIDLAPWRARLEEVDLASFLRERGPSLRYHDQDALNILFRGAWISLPPAWNVHTDITRCATSARHLLQARGAYDTAYSDWCMGAVADRRIIHYTGPSKPWNHHGAFPFHDEYWAVRDRTPYRQAPEDRRVPWMELGTAGPLWIYGASQGGSFTLVQLQALGLPVAGFLDTYKPGRFADFPVLLPDDWAALDEPGTVVIGSMFWRPMLAEIRKRVVDATVFVSYPFLTDTIFRFDQPTASSRE